MWTIVGKPTTQDWTRTAKPAESSVILSGGNAGEPIGLLLALTYAGTISSVTSGWSEITKPTVASWVAVAKPIS